ncbi:protein with an N-terminal kelch-like domain [Teratosphaeriaceae sp. CCFEE 6253]|nr:protein with an N-terminal kelch-like domain [Teratosphaeriaceae sp. CCFEE 6253]
MPEGCNTECGHGGSSRLSGGQRQRVALARALIRDPEILLLDEPTSALDAHSEQHIQRALAEVSKGRTTVMVAHRLASIRHVDKICVFDGGRIVEEGTHEQLIARVLTIVWTPALLISHPFIVAVMQTAYLSL